MGPFSGFRFNPLLSEGTDLGNTYGGVPVRSPFSGETNFFLKSGVPAYAAPDNKVVFSPMLTDPNAQRALAMNEAARVWMRQNNLKPDFNLTPQQDSFLNSNSYAQATPEERRATIAARLLSGDPSAGTPNAEQEAFVKRLRYSMGLLPFLMK